MPGLLVTVLLLAAPPAPPASRQPNVTAILPADEPTVPVAYAPPLRTQRAAPAPAPPPSRVEALPRTVVGGGRVLAYVAAEVTCGLVLWALVTLPVVSWLTGPLALGLAMVVVPLASAAAAVVAGDYLSGDRHSLAWSALTAIGATWVGAAAWVALETALLGAVTALGYQLLRGVLGGSPEVVLVDVARLPQASQQVGAAWRAGTFAPLVAAAVLGAAASSAGLVACLALPAVVNTVVLELTRQEVAADQKLPRMW